MPTEKPLISVITVSYNSIKTIRDTLQCILDQTYENIEYILVDGASNDGTIEVIKNYESLFNQRNIQYRYISEPDSGIYYAMNKGIQMCNGDLIGIINSDDWYEKNAIENIVNTYLDNKSFDIFHGLLKYISYDGLPDSISGHYFSVLDQKMIEHPTCFVKKESYKAVGLFDEKYKSAADYEWMLRARNANLNFLFLNSLIANFRRGGMSESYISGIEILNIKKKYRILSTYKWYCLRFYRSLIPWIQKLS